jgi:long-chain acyl-CoA synthetase
MAILVNKFTVAGSPEEFERTWKESSEFMRHQPGFIRARLVRSVTDGQVYINIAEWADAESHQRVVGSSNFQAHIAALAGLAKPEPTMCELVTDEEPAT